MFNEKILNNISDFLEEHNKCFAFLKNNKAPYIIKIYPTGISDSIFIKCNKCKTQKDVNDYNSW